LHARARVGGSGLAFPGKQHVLGYAQALRYLSDRAVAARLNRAHRLRLERPCTAPILRFFTFGLRAGGYLLPGCPLEQDHINAVLQPKPQSALTLRQDRRRTQRASDPPPTFIGSAIVSAPRAGSLSRHPLPNRQEATGH
jgi:hypothetical protein